MPFRSAVYIVCSPRPRIGRTLLARVLVDFCLSQHRDVAAFDLNAEPDLTRFLPRHCEAASVAGIDGQMALFDRLVAADDIAKIVDVGAPALNDFLKVARDIAFVDEAQRRAIAIVFLYVVTPDAIAVELYAKMRRDFPQAIFLPVQNEALGKFQLRGRFPASGGPSSLLQLGLLSPALRKQVDEPPFSFLALPKRFVRETPRELQDQLQRWLRQAFIGFRELELRILLNDVRESLQTH